ncbi:hypothetical protein AB182_20595 [Phytobacter ursingii]|uniref:Uncharacterized protein n=1 Tax=Phytobacter ursingii TaxID=1972431 RepID=A0AAC8QRA1_9ENTR|nr:hypothetical protein AB182_20595 [Phytobacter ursingii]
MTILTKTINSLIMHTYFHIWRTKIIAFNRNVDFLLVKIIKSSLVFFLGEVDNRWTIIKQCFHI